MGKCECQLTIRRIDPQIDGHIGNAFVAARHSVRLSFNFLSDLVKVNKLLALAVQELAKLCVAVDQLQNQRTTCHNSRASRQKVPKRRRGERFKSIFCCLASFAVIMSIGFGQT